MLLEWLLGAGVHGCSCSKPPKELGCLRGKDCDEVGVCTQGNLVEYAPHGQSKTSAAELVIDDALFQGLLPAGPAERTVPTYSTRQEGSAELCLQGFPLFSGEVLRLSLGDSIHEATMTLYVNGFLMSPRGSELPSSVSQTQMRLWSPFTLVEKCQVKARSNEGHWAIFKLTIFRKEGQDASYYFATAGNDAEWQRDRWVEELTQVVSNLTLSLFPRFELSVDPVPGRVATTTRIMAGYLLLGGIADKASLVFGELHAYAAKEARLVLYQDEWCEHEVLNLVISDMSVVSTRKGAYCTVFGINDQLFSARTEDERELWLRAVSNIKVKLMFDAPDPSPEDLQVFRSAVSERIGTLPPPLPPGGKEAAEAFAAAALGTLGTSATEGGTVIVEPVLSQVPRRPPAGPLGDACEDPVAEDAFDMARQWNLETDLPTMCLDEAPARAGDAAAAPPGAAKGAEPETPEEPPETIPRSKLPEAGVAPQMPLASMISSAVGVGGLQASPAVAWAVVSMDAPAGEGVEGL